MSTEKTGRFTLSEAGRTYRATWRVAGAKVEITSEFGVTEAALGALASAPAAVAQEAFRETVRRASRPAKPASDRARFDIRSR